MRKERQRVWEGEGGRMEEAQERGEREVSESARKYSMET
jgi:hypothetical protein